MPHMRPNLLLLSLSSLLLQGSQPGTRDQTPVLAHRGRFVIEAGEHRLRDLVTRSAQLLERTELVNWAESEEGGNTAVTVQTRRELDRSGFEDTMSQLLWSRAWVLTTVDRDRGIFEWIHAGGPRTPQVLHRATELRPEEVSARPGLATVVRTTLRLAHMDPIRAANTLRPQFPAPRLGIDPITPLALTHSVMLQGMREDVLAGLRMLTTMDQPQDEAQDGPPLPAGIQPGGTTGRDRLAALEARVLALEKLVEELRRK